MKVRDIMKPIVDYLSPDTTLHEAVRIMKRAKRDEGKYDVKGIVVLDEKRKPRWVSISQGHSAGNCAILHTDNKAEHFCVGGDAHGYGKKGCGEEGF